MRFFLSVYFLSQIFLLSTHQAFASEKCSSVLSNPTQPEHPIELLNFAPARLAILAREGKLLNQTAAGLEDAGLISTAEGSGLCTTACAVNSLITLKNPYLKNTAPLDKIKLAKRFVEIAEALFPGINPRNGFDLEKIAKVLPVLGAEVGLNLKVTSKIIDDHGSIGLGDFYQSKQNEIVLLSIWTVVGSHAIAVSEIDPISRRAKIVDPNFPDFVQTAVIMPGSFNEMPTEKIEYPIRGMPKHQANGSILKVVKISTVEQKTWNADDYRPKEVKTLGGPRSNKRPPLILAEEPIVTMSSNTKSAGLASNETLGKVTLLHERLNAFKQKNDQWVPIDFNKEVDLIYFMRTDDALSLTKGLLNQHQTQSSNGSFAPAARKRNEDLLMGFDVGSDKEALSFRPKSTYLNIRNDKNYGWYSDDMVSHYGGVGIVLKPQVKLRSIWSAGDSFELLSQATHANDAKVLSKFGSFNESEILKSEGLYLEALTFGKIEIEEMDYLLVLKKEMAAPLRQLGLPIYFMEIKRVSGRFISSQGERLF